MIIISDVFQDSIIVLYKQITDNTLSLTTDLKGYFFSVARNIWNNSLRKKKITLELQTEIPDDPGYEEAAELVLERIVGRAFEKIGPENREVLTLFSEGHSYEEIAKLMKYKNEIYARRKKYLAKEALLEKMKEDPEYREFYGLRK
jgi:RNA polymerase sigma factor (sigma-70 family)